MVRVLPHDTTLGSVVMTSCIVHGRVCKTFYWAPELNSVVESPRHDIEVPNYPTLNLFVLHFIHWYR